jgi:20S proteasome alpha/beta subunit
MTTILVINKKDKVFLAADRKVSAGHIASETESKILEKEGILMAFAGNASAIDKVESEIEKNNILLSNKSSFEIAETLQSLLYELGSEALIVKNGEVSLATPQQSLKLTATYEAIGSGAESVMSSVLTQLSDKDINAFSDDEVANIIEIAMNVAAQRDNFTGEFKLASKGGKDVIYSQNKEVQEKVSEFIFKSFDVKDGGTFGMIEGIVSTNHIDEQGQVITEKALTQMKNLIESKGLRILAVNHGNMVNEEDLQIGEANVSEIVNAENGKLALKVTGIIQTKNNSIAKSIYRDIKANPKTYGFSFGGMAEKLEIKNGINHVESFASLDHILITKKNQVVNKNTSVLMVASSSEKKVPMFESVDHGIDWLVLATNGILSKNNAKEISLGFKRLYSQQTLEQPTQLNSLPEGKPLAKSLATTEAQGKPAAEEVEQPESFNSLQTLNVAEDKVIISKAEYDSLKDSILEKDKIILKQSDQLKLITDKILQKTKPNNK